jgi:V/A-type H+-transporting ATPase subunit D
MELLGLRRRLSLARRGHHLLSEKRDEISRHLVRIARQLGAMRRRIDRQLQQAFRRFMLARAMVEPEQMQTALEVPAKQARLEVDFAAIMNVKVPRLAVQMSGQVLCYGFSATSGELDLALEQVEKAFEELVSLAGMEKQARLLAAELSATRRRVNVLEHVVIPELMETIRFIFDKLSEVERDNISRLMKITDIIRG